MMSKHLFSLLLLLALLFTSVAAHTAAQTRTSSLPTGEISWRAGPPRADAAAILASATQVAVGESHACALTGEGGVKCWGLNSSGQLGDGTTTDQPVPVDVSGLTSGVVAVAAGSYHTCALITGGSVKCWGRNSAGQLGDGTRNDRWTPVDVSGLGSRVAAVAAGGSHTCALTAAGGVKCWGNNAFGQLGGGAIGFVPIPVDVSGLTSGAAAVTTGANHTCALTGEGGAYGVKCWGGNWYGQLGDGTTAERHGPVSVSGLTGVAAVAAGHFHTCALTAAGALKCWGNNPYGQLGDGTTTNQAVPVDVSGLVSGVAAVTAGADHTCALVAVGGGLYGARCWGSNGNGQLGDGTAADRHTPADVSGLRSGAAAVAAGRDLTCALTDWGSSVYGVKCWGSGLLGDGRTTPLRSTLVEVPGLSQDISAVAVGGGHTCVLTGEREGISGVSCWGLNVTGQLGDGTTGSRYTPLAVAGLASGVAAAGAGADHTCAVTRGSGGGAYGVKCWGGNAAGQLGDGTTIDRPTPVDVSGLATGAAAVATGENYTCALTSGSGGARGVKCWGRNASGELGDGTTIDRRTPVDVSGLAGGAAGVAAGGDHTCALVSGGDGSYGVKCWGNNSYGQLGDGTTANRYTPVDVIGLTRDVTAVTLGVSHTCALTEDGRVKCWGENSDGELGDGTAANRHTPVDVSGLGSGVLVVAAGAYHTCAVTSEGAVKCWGSNHFGQLGDGTTTGRPAPVAVSGLSSGVVAVACGLAHTCALTSVGAVKCWGANWHGQLGVNPGWAPVDVVGFEGGTLSNRLYLPLVHLAG